MTYPSAEDIRDIIAGRADLDRNDDGTYSTETGDGKRFLVEIKVHDVTGA